MLISAQNITKSFLDDIILDGVSLEVNEGDRIGLLGVNGAGKSTLLNSIAGLLEPDEGIITRARGLEIGYLQQNDALTGSRSLQEEAKDAFAKVYAVQAKMADCAKKLAEAPEDKALLAEYDKLQIKFEAMDGYHIDDKINRVLEGLGFGGFNRDTLVSTLSGGEKMRFGFAKMLLSQPGLLMLDEPTNHLDFSMLSWLEEYLSTYKGAVLVVSHDRYFLDAIAKDICEIERTKLTRYAGGYSSFVVQKAERRKVAMRAWEKQQEEIEKMEEYVRKNLARSSSASSVGSRVKALEKMERLAKPPAEQKTISLNFDYDVEPFKNVLICENLGVSVGEGAEKRRLFSGVGLEVLRGEKMALVGLNGVGKTTFLKAVQNMVGHDGTARWGANTRIGYFDQELAGLNMDITVMEAVHSQYPSKTEFEIRSALGRLLLEGDTAFKKVRELSGAMRAKVAFAILQMRRANVLLMDEPTNHLDYRAKEVLETALRQFEGTLLVVSHDRYFLRKVPSVILELEPDGFTRYNGNYDDYLEQKKEGKTPAASFKQAKQPAAEAEDEKTAPAYRSKQQRAQDAQRRNKINSLEKEVERLEKEIAEDTAEMENPETAADYKLLEEVSKRLQENQTALEAAMDEWLGLTAE